jgi:hypothetical protein
MKRKEPQDGFELEFHGKIKHKTETHDDRVYIYTYRRISSPFLDGFEGRSFRDDDFREENFVTRLTIDMSSRSSFSRLRPSLSGDYLQILREEIERVNGEERGFKFPTKRKGRQ